MAMIEMSLDKVHNEVAGEMLKKIVTKPIEAGGDLTDSVIILESLILGVMLLAARKGWEVNALMEELDKRVKQRMVLAGPVQGNA
jgi:hypothetical protein